MTLLWAGHVQNSYMACVSHFGSQTWYVYQLRLEYMYMYMFSRYIRQRSWTNVMYIQPCLYIGYRGLLVTLRNLRFSQSNIGPRGLFVTLRNLRFSQSIFVIAVCLFVWCLLVTLQNRRFLQSIMVTAVCYFVKSPIFAKCIYWSPQCVCLSVFNG